MISQLRNRSPQVLPSVPVISTAGGLHIEGLEVSYGSSQALFGISLSARAGTALAVLGVNGAGKSTLGRALSGLVPIKAGRIYFDGQDITGWAPHEISRAGLIYIPEGRGIFPGLSVSDNLKMAVRQLPTHQDRQQAIESAHAVFPVLAQRAEQRAGSLSGGEQQMLAMARALAVNPKIIIADEMSLGLAPHMITAVFDGLERARQAGITVILIEQFIHRALAFADEALILTRGTVSWSGDASSASEEVLDRYLGNDES